MKTPISKFLVVLFSLVFCQVVHSAPYGQSGRPTQFTQPSGKVIQLRMFGDEYYARTETPSGHTVVFDHKSNAYFYAKPSADGGNLESTGVLADLPPPAGIPTHADITPEAVRQSRASRITQADIDRMERWKQRVDASSTLRAARQGAAMNRADMIQAQAKAAPLVGNVIGLTLLVQFQDVKFPANQTKMLNLLNQDNYTEDGNSGSVKDYFFDQSNGLLTYTQEVPVVITLSGRRADYNKGDAGTAGRKLIKEALQILVNRGFDPTNLTVNDDGLVLATNVFFAGPDSGVWAQGLWPHQWVLESPVPLGMGKLSYAYQITNLENDKPVIGTFCHENGHLITDYPDLYDYDGDSSGVGMHCLMGSGNYLNDGKTPAPINLYFKDMVGWANIEEVSPTASRRVWLPTTGNQGCRVTNPNNPAEFFVIENRGDGDKWAEFAMDKGIMIWHVDDDVLGNDYQQRTPSQHYQVSLEQADGQFSLENNINNGDAGDLYDLLRAKFDKDSVPNSDWWSGAESGVSITVRDIPAETVRVDFGQVETNKITVLVPNNGEIWFHNDTRVIEWVAGIDDTVEIDLMLGDAVVQNLATGELSDGAFEWTIPPSISPSSNYKIRVTGTLNSSITDESDVPFEIKDQRSLADAVDQPDRDWTTTGSTAWVAQTANSYDEEDAAQTGPLADGQSSTIRSVIEGPCQVSFRWRVSSLADQDFLSVAVEGSPEIQVPAPISGDTSWMLNTIELPEGAHTVAWTLARGTQPDDFSARMAWLDQVVITPRVPDMEVTDMFGTILANNASTIGLGASTAQGDPLSHTVTVWNNGDAIIKNIAVSIASATKPGFSVAPATLPNLAPGESAEVTVTLQPQISGVNSAVLRFTSNDPDESPYSINLIAEISGPKMVVMSGNTEIANGSSLEFASTVVGQPVTRTLEIRNNGQASLKNITVSTASSPGSSLTITSIPSIVYPGYFGTVTVTFLATVPGNHTGTITVRSNDIERTPFVLPCKVSAVTAPDLGLQEVRDAQELEIVNSLDFGPQPLGEGPKAVKLRVLNRGSNVLSDIRLAKAGVHADEFSIVGSLPDSLPPGQKAEVWVSFLPKAAGYRFTDIVVTSNDPKNPRRSIKVFGDGRLMPMASLGIKNSNGVAIPVKDGVLSFRKTAVQGITVSNTLTLENTGIIKVSDIQLEIKGTAARDFTITKSPASSLGVGGSTTFTVSFDPSAVGKRSAALHILSNDPVQPRIVVKLTGTGIKNKGPDIDVRLAGGSPMIDGKASLRMNASNRKTLRLTVSNHGDETLKSIRLSTAGAGAKEFRVSRAQLKNIAPGRSETIQVSFVARQPGFSKAALRIWSDDKDENPFDIRLHGKN